MFFVVCVGGWLFVFAFAFLFFVLFFYQFIYSFLILLPFFHFIFLIFSLVSSHQFVPFGMLNSSIACFSSPIQPHPRLFPIPSDLPIPTSMAERFSRRKQMLDHSASVPFSLVAVRYFYLFLLRFGRLLYVFV